jgi:hypothetical protein
VRPWGFLGLLTVTAVAGTALAGTALAGCSISLPADAIPAPYSIAPAPSASVGQPDYVCTAVYQILTSGAARVANSLGSDEKAKTAMRANLADMADRVTAEGLKTEDPQLKTAIGEVAESLTGGSKQADPMTYVSGGFKTVGEPLDAACK